MNNLDCKGIARLPVCTDLYQYSGFQNLKKSVWISDFGKCIPNIFNRL